MDESLTTDTIAVQYLKKLDELVEYVHNIPLPDISHLDPKRPAHKGLWKMQFNTDMPDGATMEMYYAACAYKWHQESIDWTTDQIQMMTKWLQSDTTKPDLKQYARDRLVILQKELEELCQTS